MEMRLAERHSVGASCLFCDLPAYEHLGGQTDHRQSAMVCLPVSTNCLTRMPRNATRSSKMPCAYMTEIGVADAEQHADLGSCNGGGYLSRVARREPGENDKDLAKPIGRDRLQGFDA